MSRRKLRKDKKCLNCETYVVGRYCHKCGQENVENRPSVGELFAEAFGALFHMDSNFWVTLKVLLFKPGFIINEFLAGKRKSYVPPIRLYIFASFFAFLLPVILPEIPKDIAENEMKLGPVTIIQNKGKSENETVAEDSDSVQIALTEEIPDSLNMAAKEDFEAESKDSVVKNKRTISPREGIDIGFDEDDDFFYDADQGFTFYKEYKNIKTVSDFDSIHRSLPKEDRLNSLFVPFAQKMSDLHERRYFGEDMDRMKEVFTDLFRKNLPKALFIYLPLFAFFLWVFHGKKKWKYYDHAVFTLFYFSFLLILISLNILFNRLAFQLIRVWPGIHDFINITGALLGIAATVYAFFYFFRAHSRVYKEPKWISILKGFTLFGINFMLIMVVLSIYTIITIMLL